MVWMLVYDGQPSYLVFDDAWNNLSQDLLCVFELDLPIETPILFEAETNSLDSHLSQDFYF